MEKASLVDDISPFFSGLALLIPGSAEGFQYPFVYNLPGFDLSSMNEDERALASDWLMVGHDIREASEQFASQNHFPPPENPTRE